MSNLLVCSSEEKQALKAKYDERLPFGRDINKTFVTKVLKEIDKPFALYGYSHQTKSFESSLAAIIKDMQIAKKETFLVAQAEDALRVLPDLFRYNFLLFDDSVFCDAVLNALTAICNSYNVLSILGHNRFARKNPGCKDLQYTFCVLIGNEKVFFEVQFQSVDSEKANFWSHPIYEKWRILSPNDPDYQKLKNDKNCFYDKVYEPIGLSAFLDDRKEMKKGLVIQYI